MSSVQSRNLLTYPPPPQSLVKTQKKKCKVLLFYQRPSEAPDAQQLRDR